MLTWSIWTSCPQLPQPRFRARDLHALFWLQRYDFMWRHLNNQPFSKHFSQADLSMLAQMVGTASVLVVLSGSFRSQCDAGGCCQMCFVSCAH